MAEPENVVPRSPKNVVLRTAVYYVVLFGVAALLWRLPVAKAVMEGSLDALFAAQGVPGLGAPTTPQADDTPIDANDACPYVAAAMLGAVLLALRLRGSTALREKEGLPAVSRADAHGAAADWLQRRSARQVFLAAGVRLRRDRRRGAVPEHARGQQGRGLHFSRDSDRTGWPRLQLPSPR